MDLVAAIEGRTCSQRHSIRRYERRSVSKETIQQTVAKGRNAAPLYPDIHVRWYIVWNGSVLSRRLDGLSGIDGRTVRGMFTTAPHYIIAVSQVRPGYMENLGFRMEQLILSATTLGLGTCWVGDMLSEQGAHSDERVPRSLEEKLHDFIPDLGADERIVALTPLGYADTSRAAQMARQLIRWSTNRRGRHKSLQEIVFQDIWGIPWVSDNETLQRLFELTRLAPSLANTQPWHFIVDEKRIISTVSRFPQAPLVTGSNVHKGKPYHRLDGGIAMCHFYLAAQAAGWSGQWHTLPGNWRPWAGEHVPRSLEQIRIRYAIPADYDILGIWQP